MKRNEELHAVWNTLHDGTIEAISGVFPGDIAMTVGIEYLCGMLPTAAEHLIVNLRGCNLLRFGAQQTAYSGLPNSIALQEKFFWRLAAPTLMS